MKSYLLPKLKDQGSGILPLVSLYFIEFFSELFLRSLLDWRYILLEDHVRELKIRNNENNDIKISRNQKGRKIW
jgi:hypothetical protein